VSLINNVIRNYFYALIWSSCF